jgi:asparagine synthase (glutamine-hydrolysing)
MCGIAGIFYFNAGSARSDLLGTVDKLLPIIKHRGPDDTGTATFTACALGHVRLSIIDLASGHQPMCDETTRFTIVFNGEIYNFKALRNDLEGLGHRFATHSDTEVILRGFMEWGAKVFERLDGMFALAIYDKAEHCLTLARDRVGKKPLYFHLDHEKLIFCSELRGIMNAPGLDVEIDRQAYWDYLTYRYSPGESTVIQGVTKLPPAHYARLAGGRFEATRYWDFPQTAKRIPARGKCVEEFGRLFSDATRKRLVADVPVGVILSGGIDSCAVLYEASRFQTLDSYHVHFPGEGDHSELPYATLMAKSVGSRLHTVEIRDEVFLDSLSEMSSMTDEPLSDLSAIPFKHVCDLAAGSVKVGLSGEGSDESLAGYDLEKFYWRHRLLRTIQSTPLLPSILRTVLRGSRRLDALDIPADEWPLRNHYNITFQGGQKFKLGLAAATVAFLPSERFLEANYRRVAGEDALNQILHVISRDWLTENVLMKSDKVSMSSSLEIRCPFLDRDLLEFLFRLPGRRKVGLFGLQYESKILLRRYLSGRIPDQILFRKKLGFPVPATSLLTQKYRDYVFDRLSEPSAFYRGIFDSKKILQLFDECVRQPHTHGSQTKHFLWGLVTFENWYRREMMTDRTRAAKHTGMPAGGAP